MESAQRRSRVLLWDMPCGPAAALLCTHLWESTEQHQEEIGDKRNKGPNSCISLAFPNTHGSTEGKALSHRRVSEKEAEKGFAGSGYSGIKAISFNLSELLSLHHEVPAREWNSHRPDL